MLKSLHIRNYVLIDSLEIDFPAGLVIITGQTGAGKSIILGALSLLLGEKADVTAIGSEGDSCVVEAEFSIKDETGGVSALLETSGIDFDPEEGTLIIRRVLNKSGRSRAFVNDCPAQLKVLSALSSRLLDIHSQHETMLLRDKSFQMSMLDHFAGDQEVLAEYKKSWHHLAELKKEYDDVVSSLKKARAEQDYNQSLFEQLDAAKLQDGELESLEAEQKQLANAEEIKGTLVQVENLFSPQDDDSHMTLDQMLKESSRALEKISSYLPSVSPLAERIDASRLELDDILSEISSLESSVEISDDRLQEVEDRLSLLYGLLKKHSATTIAELIQLRDTLSDSLADTSVLEERCSALKNGIDKAEKELAEAAKALHAVRAKAIPAFSKSICDSIRSLELERAVFDVELSSVEPGPEGADSILFRFSSTGKNPIDVARCASGGEMSRIMLCLKSLMARYTNMPTMVFDEIDTGVSGSVADKMGSMICSMGDYMQVFAITHLPQVAAKGEAHYVVTKEFSGDKAVTSIKRVNGRERVMEVARILSGAEVTPAAIANAESLLGFSV